MALIDVLQNLLLDPFRIGLMVALIYTARRNAAVTGRWLPLAAGVVFVAVMLPATMGPGAAAGLPMAQVIGLGVLANAVILALALAGWALAEWLLARFRQR